MNTLDKFLTKLALDIDDIITDLDYDFGPGTVAADKMSELKKFVEDYQDDAKV
jgi:hypothetical protein